MEYTCESFLDYAYEGDVKISFTVRIQNAITKLIEIIKKFILKIRALKGERVVPKKVLDAYRSLSKACFDCVVQCKNSLQSGQPVKVAFREPFDTPEYKILFSEDVKKKTSPGEYVKIQSSEVLGFMNGALTGLSSAKQGLRSVDKEKNPNQAQALTQIINYSKFMMKISNRVLSYKNMYVEKRHLPTTKVDETESVNEVYLDCIHEIDIAMEGIFGNLFKKKPKIVSTQAAKKLENEIRKKVLNHLKSIVKEDEYAKEYKNAVCSFPSMKLAIAKDGVQVATTKDGILEPKDWPPHIKDRYYEINRSIQIYDEFPDEFDNRWFMDLMREGVEWCKDNCPVPDNFILQVTNADFDGTIIYIEVFEKIGEKANESIDQIVEEGILNIFKKNPKLPQATTEEIAEIKNLEADIKNKCVSHLKSYVKKKNFDQRYKNAICSYPAMHIHVNKDCILVCDTEDPFVNPSKFPPHIKKTYDEIGEIYRTGSKYPKEFNYMWAVELIKEAVRFCNYVYKLPDKYEIYANEPDGDDSPCSMYVEIDLKKVIK